MSNELSNNVPLFWRDTYLGNNSDITMVQVVEAFVKNVPGMAAVDIGNCLIHLMIFCKSGSPTDLQQATEYLDHCNSFYYGINPNWNATKGENK